MLVTVIFLAAVGGIIGLVLLLGGGDDGESEPAETSAEDAGSAKATTEDAGLQDCDEAGINAEVQNEGTCLSEGDEVVVVNRDSTLRLSDLTARVENVELTDSVSGQGEGFGTEVADGQFVVIDLTVKNLLDSPVSFDSEGQALLTSSGKEFTEDFDALNGPVPDSFLWQGEEIQPGATQTGALVYDIPDRFAANVETDGNIAVFAFADAARSVPKLPYGLIRLYPPASSSAPTDSTATTTP